MYHIDTTMETNKAKVTRSNPVTQRLSSKIDKKALLFLKKVAKRNAKVLKEDDPSPKERVNNQVNENVLKKSANLREASTISSVTAEISEPIIAALSVDKLQQVIEECGGSHSVSGNKHMVTGSWEIIQNVKSLLDEIKASVVAEDTTLKQEILKTDAQKDTHQQDFSESNEKDVARYLENSVRDEIEHDVDDALHENETPTDNLLYVSESEQFNSETPSESFSIPSEATVNGAYTVTDCNMSLPESSTVTECNMSLTEVTSATIVPDCKVSLSDVNPCDTMVTIAPNRGQVHRVIHKCPDLATEVCEHCGYLSSKEGVSRHKQRRHPKVVYKCQICDAAFGIRYDMRRHRMTHFNKNGTLTRKGRYLFLLKHPDHDPDAVNCQDFEENFSTDENQGCVGDLQNSLVKEESESQALVESRRTFPQDIQYVEADQVLRSRKSEKPRYPPRDTTRGNCRICNKNYPLKVLAVHMKIHRQKEFMPCEHCGEKFTELGKLNAHIKAKHAREYTCVLCGLIFTANSVLKTHIEAVHGHTVHCTMCNKSFPTAIAVAAHIKRVHTYKKNYNCDICHHRFADKRSLANHRITHCDEETKESFKKHSCSFCGKKFLSKHVMQMHENTHTGNKPYKCKYCGKGFTYLSMLYKHLKVHSDVKTSKCPLCHKGFKFPYKLRHHMIMHTKEKKHACSVCGKVYTTSTSLKYHNCTGKVNLPQLLMERDGQVVEINIKSEEGKQILHEFNQNQAQLNPQKTLYVCGFCNQSFDDVIEVNSHVLTHQTGENNIEIDQVNSGENNIEIDQVNSVENSIEIDHVNSGGNVPFDGSEIIKKEQDGVEGECSEVWGIQDQETVIYEDVLIEEKYDPGLVIQEQEHTVIESQTDYPRNVVVRNSVDGSEFVIQVQQSDS